MRYVAAFMPKGSGVCLDAGCGAGCLYRELIEAKGYQWRGMDIVESKDGTVANLLQLPFKDNSFDAVLCVDVLEHIEDCWKAISEMKRVLVKGGTLITHVPNALQTHLLIEPEEQESHVRSGFVYKNLCLGLMKVGFAPQLFKPTFTWNEALVWDFFYAATHNKTLDLDKLLNTNVESFMPYGLLNVWRLNA